MNLRKKDSSLLTEVWRACPQGQNSDKTIGKTYKMSFLNLSHTIEKRSEWNTKAKAMITFGPCVLQFQ